MKHKITATVQWEIETREPDVVKAASVQLQKMLPNLVSGRILKIDNLKPRRQKKIIGSFAVNDVFPFITNEEERRDYFVDGSCHSIRMNRRIFIIHMRNITHIDVDFATLSNRAIVTNVITCVENSNNRFDICTQQLGYCVK